MANRKVLIVEDEEDICGFMKSMLETQGCEVFIALKAEEAWEIFQRERPQACSIDLHLSYSAFDGITLLEKIREVDKNIFCLVFTRIADNDQIERTKAAGADAIFFKPPEDSEQLRQIIGLLAKGTRKGVDNG